MLTASLVQLSFVDDSPLLTTYLPSALCLLNPLYPLIGCLSSITKVGALPASPFAARSASLADFMFGSPNSQMTFLPSLYKENFFEETFSWQNLVIAIIAVGIM